MTEIELIEKAVREVGIKSLLNHGAASCVFSEGVAGVSQAHLVAFTREVALHCAVQLAGFAPTPAASGAAPASLSKTDIARIWRRVTGGVQFQPHEYVLFRAIADEAAALATPVQVAPKLIGYAVERSAFRVSPHGQDAESREWMEFTDDPKEKGAFPVYAAPVAPQDDARDAIRREAFEQAAKEPRAYAEMLEKGGWGNRFPDELCAIFNASTNMAERIRALADAPAAKPTEEQA